MMISNSAEFNFEDLFIVFGPENLKNINKEFKAQGVSTDTRSIKNGNIFIALKGENYDGHDYISKAIEKGASIIICQKEWLKDNEIESAHIVCENSLESFGKIANYHRKRFNIPVVAIAGSNGKTSTKEIASLVLSKKYNVLKTYKNFNNKIGTALTLLSINESHTAAVIEIGTSEMGEIYYLAKMVEPTLSLITNIGNEHLEFLEDIDGVEMEETQLFAWSRQNNAMAFVNLDDTRLKRYVKVLEKRLAYGTHQDANLKLSYDENDLLKPKINFKYELEEIDVELKNPGYSNIINSTAAAAIGFWLDVPTDKIKEALEEYMPQDDAYGRLKIELKGEHRIINDTYNANPESMQEALKVLKLDENENKIAFLGDMRELGDASFVSHKNIIEFASKNSKEVILLGEEFKLANSDLNFENVTHFSDQNTAITYLQEKIKTSRATILFKASRGLKFENIIKELF